MPSPKCPIPIAILPSAAIIPLAEEQNQTFIPSSIQPNRIATVDGFIKARLRIPQVRASPEPYVSHCDISLTATMPYLNRRLDDFDVSKRITIQYPVDLREFYMLPNVAQGSRTDFSWNIKNKGVKKVGFGTNSTRQLKMNVSIIPEASGHLLTRKLGLEDIHGSDATTVEPNDSLSVKQTVHVSDDVEDYSDMVLRVTLSISTPESIAQSAKFRDVQCCDLKVRVSSVYQYNEQSLFLVVTNEKTTRSQLFALQHLIQDELGSQMDMWNVALYGGLQQPNPEDEKTVLDIMSNYKKGVTFILLGESFDFYGTGPRSILHLSAPSLVGRAYQKDVSCLFLGLLDEADARSWIQLMAYPVHSCLQDAMSQTATSSTFANEELLVQSLTQMKSHENIALATYTLPVRKKWYLSSARSLEQRAKEVASHLRRHLPQERFWICPTELGTAGEQELAGKLAIFHGVPLSARSVITERRDLRSAHGPSASAVNLAAPTPRLSLLDQYSCVQALSIPFRIDLILRPSNAGTVAQTSDSGFAITAATWSLIEDFDAEIHAFLHKATRPSSTSFSSNAESEQQRGLAVHLPAVATWFSHSPQSAVPEEQALSKNVVLIIRYLLASSSAQKKRHTAARLLPPFRTRRSTLRAFLQAKIAGFLTNQGQTDAEIRTFFAQWKSWRAKEVGSARGGTADAIARSVVPLLKTSEHVYRAGRVRAGDVGLERTRVCTREEWDARAKAVQQWERRMRGDGERARAKLEECSAEKDVGDDRM